jgi:hypothetical protein
MQTTYICLVVHHRQRISSKSPGMEGISQDHLWAKEEVLLQQDIS